MLRWIHLSDIHFSGKEEYAIKRMRDTILEKIEQISQKKDFNMIFITGDLAYQGGSYDQSLIAFIKSLIKVLKLSSDDLFMIPGNHDVCRSQMRTLIIEGTRKDNFKFEKDTIMQLQKDFREYKEFYKNLKGENADYIYKIIKKGNYNVFLMNTAFTAGTNNDEGNLVLERDCFYDTIKSLKDQEDCVNIAIGHHPILHFVRADQQIIWNNFNDYNIDFYLCGHQHKGAYDFNLSGDRQIATYQCGSGRVDDYATVTFFVGELDIDKNTGKLVPYKWLPKEECWAIGGIDGRRAISGEMSITLERHKILKVQSEDKPPGHEYITTYKESERKFVVTHKTNTRAVSYFTGREKELQDLRQRIEEGHKVILVSGMGGIGKTHICRKLFEKYVKRHKKGEDEHLHHIGYIEYNGDMDSSLMECLRYKEQDNPKLNKEAAWKELRDLASEGEFLLFIDNVDKSMSEDPGLKRLKTIPGAIILTSRQTSLSDEFESYHIGFLDKKQCIKIFKTIRFEDSERNITIEEIYDLEYVIETLAGMHTITVELLAHLAKTKLWTVKRLRKELEEKNFRLMFHKNGELVNIQESYEKLFSLSRLTEAEKNILEAFSIFPYIPLATEACNKWLLADARVDENSDILMGLYQKGWMQLDLEKDSYALHPVFAQFIFDECKPKKENHYELIKVCQEYLKISESGSALECQRYIPFAENIYEKLLNENDIEQAVFISHIAYLLKYIAEYKKAEVLYEKALRTREWILGEEHLDTATSYNDLALVYFHQGKYEKAEALYEKALRIRERIRGEEHSDTAESYNNLAGIYESQGEYKKAEALYEKALRINERILGKEHPDTAISYNNLAEIYERQGEYKKAEALYEKALRIRERVRGEEHPDTAISYNNLAGIYKCQGEYKKAEALYEKALRISEQILGEEHPDTATNYNNLGLVYCYQGEYKKAETLYEKALRIRERVLGEEHPDTATSYHNLAGIYERQGEYKKAKALYEKALRIRERVLGEKHPDTAISYNSLGGVYNSQGEYEKAEVLYEKALRVRERILGKEHPDTAISYNSLGGVYYHQREYKKAEILYEKALRINEQILGEEHLITTTSYHNLAGIYERQGEYKKAKALYEKALRINEQILGEEHPDTAISYHNLAGIYERQGEYKKAKALYEKALRINEQILGKEHPNTATSYHNLAELYKCQGEYKKAKALCEKALRINEQILGEEHPDTATSYNNLAGIYYHQGEYKKAEALYEKALKINEQILGEEHLATATSYNNLGLVYCYQGEYKKAKALCEKALRINEQILGEEHLATATSYNNLAEIYYHQGEYKKAEALCEKALRISEQILGEEHPDTAISYHNLAELYKCQGEYKKAEALYEKALRINEQILGKEHTNTATSYHSLAYLYTKQEKYERALSYCLKSYNIFLRKLGQSHPNTQIVYKNMQWIYFKCKPENDFEQWLKTNIEQ